MRHAALRLCIGLAGSLALASVVAQTPAGSPERGYRLYMQNMCYTCHGTVGQGGERGTGPEIAPNLWPYDAFVQQMRHPRQDMPRYPAKFVSDADFADIYAYLATIKAGRGVNEIDLLGKAP